MSIRCTLFVLAVPDQAGAFSIWISGTNIGFAPGKEQ
jgi:hypothetical protein